MIVRAVRRGDETAEGVSVLVLNPWAVLNLDIIFSQQQGPPS